MAVTGTEAGIIDALLYAVGQIVTSPVTKIANPNVTFKPVIGSPYLSVSVQPNTADVFGLEFDSDIDFQGLMQISVFWPAGQGLVKPSQVASQIAAAFPPGTTTDRNGIRVRFDRHPVVSAALIEADWSQIPVTVRWRAFVHAST